MQGEPLCKGFEAPFAGLASVLELLPMKKLLFVCMGNICRSPTGEGIMQSVVEKANLSDKIFCDSAGTIGYHTGERADSRMREHCSKRGYDLQSRARQFKAPDDFESFDYILVADDQNLQDILRQDHGDEYGHKVMKLTDFCQNIEADEVPDPYYGGTAGFDQVLNIIEEASGGLLEDIRRYHIKEA